MNLARYCEYRDSGLPLLGAIPAHWEVGVLKRVVSLVESGVSVNAVDEPVVAGGVGVLKTSCVYAGTFDPRENKAVVSEELNRVACSVKADTLIVSRMNTPALVGAAGLVHEGADNLFLPDRLWQVHFSGMIPSFAHYWTAGASYRAQVQMACAGTSASMQNLSQDEFLRFVLPLPPLVEQISIAGFLDRETSKIDTLIAEQEKLITLLAEKRQATISHAVTRGLNPDAPMKDSGVTWLGGVPAHWVVRPLKHLVKLRSGGTPSKENRRFWDGGVPWASAKDLKSEFLSDTVDHITEYALSSGASELVPAGASLIVVRGMILARLFPVAQITEPMAINQDLKAVVAGKELRESFLPWLLRGSAEESLRRLDEAGHGTKALRMDAWTSMLLPVPPINEQIEIVRFIDQQNKQLDLLSASGVNAIALLKERRSALIVAAVTGQIDVRQV